MKAISLWQPWASAIALEAKLIETRKWWTSHRGPLAIHAAKKDESNLRDFFSWQVCRPIRAIYPTFDDLPRGCIVATCKLVECIKTTDVDHLSRQEKDFGDYSAGRYAWVLDEIKALPQPVPFRGSQGLFEWPHQSDGPQTGILL